MPGATTPTPHRLVRDSCSLSIAKGVVEVDADSIHAYVERLPRERVRLSVREASGVQLPFRFDGTKSEVSFIALLNLLDFGSGYDAMMRESRGCDVKESVQRGMIALYLSLGRLDADVMNNATEFKLAEVCGVPARVDAPHPEIQGLTIEKEGPLSPLVKDLCHAMNEVGLWLWKRQFQSLGDFIVSTMENETVGGGLPSAAALIKVLAESLPAYYADEGTTAENRVFFYRKAQMMAAALYMRFKDEQPGLFNFEDIDQLTASADSILAAALQKQGIIRYNNELHRKIASGTPLSVGTTEELSIRVACICAVEQMVSLCEGSCSAVGLDHYLRQEWRSLRIEGDLQPPLVPGTLLY